MSIWPMITAWLTGRRPPKSLGERGELAAERYLRGLGYWIVARNQREPLGEIDLICVQAKTVVFVEVKTRTHDGAGSPLEAITADKQQRLCRAAIAYLKRHRLLRYRARFDVIGITWPADAQQPKLEHIQNAFPATGVGGMFG